MYGLAVKGVVVCVVLLTSRRYFCVFFSFVYERAFMNIH
jgi:hypothetical protein